MHPIRPMMIALSLALAALVGPRCRAEGLVGIWTNCSSATLATNNAERLDALEFFKDRSFRIETTMVLDGKRWTNTAYSGTYAMIGTNRVSLKITPHDIPPGSKPAPIVVSCSIDGDELQVPLFITTVVPEYRKYRRAK